MDECLNEYIKTGEECLTLLKKLKTNIEEFHERCNTVKTIGTSASVTGSLLTIGSILLAPVTGGASIVAATAIGGATAMGGALTNLTTDVVDMVQTNNYGDALHDIDERLQGVAERFTVYVDQIETEAAQYQKENGGTEEAAVNHAMVYLITTGKIGWKGKQIVDVAENVGKTTGSTLLKNGGQVWKGMRVNSGMLVSAFKGIGFDISKRAAFNVVKGATVAVSAIFVVWDIKSLIDSLNNDHPAVEPVQAQIENIEKLLKNLEELRDSIDV